MLQKRPVEVAGVFAPLACDAQLTTLIVRVLFPAAPARLGAAPSALGGEI
jgi:hypothetical protein